MKDSSMRSVLIGGLVFLLAAFGLTACGGGGSNLRASNLQPPEENDSDLPISLDRDNDSDLPSFPLDRDSARTLIRGTLLNLDSEQIKAKFEEAASRHGTSRGAGSLYLAVTTTSSGGFPIFFCPGFCQYRPPDGGLISLGVASPFINNPGSPFFTSGSPGEYQAIASRNGIPLAQYQSIAIDPFTLERTVMYGRESFEIGYGGWMDHSVFAVKTLLDTKSRGDASFVATAGFSIGDVASADELLTGSGTATWTGVMVGGDVSASSTRGNMIQGDADIAVNLDIARVEVDFTDVVDLDTGRSRNDMRWTNLPIGGGKAGYGREAGDIYARACRTPCPPADPPPPNRGTVDNHIGGLFYGPNHEETGGYFVRDEIVGAFGAKRKKRN